MNVLSDVGSTPTISTTFLASECNVPKLLFLNESEELQGFEALWPYVRKVHTVVVQRHTDALLVGEIMG